MQRIFDDKRGSTVGTEVDGEGPGVIWAQGGVGIGRSVFDCVDVAERSIVVGVLKLLEEERVIGGRGVKAEAVDNVKGGKGDHWGILSCFHLFILM